MWRATLFDGKRGAFQAEAPTPEEAFTKAGILAFLYAECATTLTWQPATGLVFRRGDYVPFGVVYKIKE